MSYSTFNGFSRLSKLSGILFLLISSSVCFADNNLSPPQAFRANFKGDISASWDTMTGSLNGVGNVAPMGVMYQSGRAAFYPDPGNICQNGVRNIMHFTLSSTPPDPDHPNQKPKDAIYITVNDVTCPLDSASSSLQGVGTYVITGGEGIYSGAVGSGLFTGAADMAAGKYNCNVNGVIQLPTKNWLKKLLAQSRYF